MYIHHIIIKYIEARPCVWVSFEVVEMMLNCFARMVFCAKENNKKPIEKKTENNDNAKKKERSSKNEYQW